ncbi:MAG: TlpA family protein disulfide reductase [Akkermansiaceae bacterium]|nr:TlpA family protein disulfide reductase [Akkermansiaceae bacterium]
MKPPFHLPLIILTLLGSLGWSADAEVIDLPQPPITQLYQDAKSQPNDKETRLTKNTDILVAARKILADHPEVPPTAPLREILVRRIMLPAAERIFADAPTPENRTQLRNIATDVVNVPVYEGHLIVPEKVRAAYILANMDIFPTPTSAPVDAGKHIRALVALFPPRAAIKEPTAFTGQATVYAAKLAIAAGEKALADEYCATISKHYLATENALTTLIQAGHAPVFEMEMTTLDGKKLSFPADTKGKVVVLDFWATWCGPCIASMPHIQKLQEKFKDQDVLIVGVSCDRPSSKETPEQNKTKVADFISNKGYNWIQTYSGEWPRSAVKYGVSRIPTVFVIGKDGRLISVTARGREEALINKALSLP